MKFGVKKLEAASLYRVAEMYCDKLSRL